MKKSRKKQRRRKIIMLLTCVIVAAVSCNRSPKANIDNEKLADIYLQRGEDSMKTNLPLSEKLSKKSMELTKDSMKYYEAYQIYSTIHYKSNHPDSAILIQRKILEYLKNIPSSNTKSDLLANIYNSLCGFYGRIGKADSALMYGKKALAYNTEKEKEPDICINIADIYNFWKGDYANAAFYLNNALVISDKLKLQSMKYPIYFALGYVYLNLRDFKKSDYFYKLAEKDYPKRQDNEKVIFCNNRGNYYYFSADYKKAKEWFNREKQIAENIHDEYMANFSYTNLADVYLHLKRYDLCKQYADKAEQYFQTIHFQTGLYYLNAIRIGLALQEKDYVLASKLKKEINSENGIDPNIVSIRNKYLEELSIKQNNYEEAYNYLKKNGVLNDSIRNDITQKKIAELSLRYRQDTILIKKEMLITQQKAEVKTLRMGYYIWILVCILIIIIAVTGYFYTKRKHCLQRQKLIEQLTKYRISNIRNRISPHFMFNVLNHEMDGIDEKKKKRFYTLAHLLRKSLETAEKVSIKLSDEIDFANDYIELEGYRAGNELEVKWDIDSDIDTERISIIPMMLQIPIENSIKHGLPQKEGEKKLIISIYSERNGIKIIISDNGIGYHPNKHNTSGGTGTGLKVLSQTMQILNEKNNEKITFRINNIEEENKAGVKVDIFIPTNYKFEY